MAEKITVSWDDLNSRRVDTRLKEQDALARNRAYSQLDAEAVKPQAPQASSRGSIFYNSTVYMALFGLLGGLLAWSAGQVLHFKSNQKADAVKLLREIDDVRTVRERGRALTDEQIAATIDNMTRQGRRTNPYFAIKADAKLSLEEKIRRENQLGAQERTKTFISNMLAFGACGLMIALCLGIAEPATDRNIAGVVVNGSVAAAMGLLGGVVIALFHEKLFEKLGGMETGELTTARQIFARTITWGVMGLFLTVGTGLVMRSFKKFGIGLLGGLLGGLIGGAIYDPVGKLTNNPEIGKLAALCAIGVVAGISTGLIENAAKTGWVRVIAGLIAGKQFILYRNPTFIGSGPDCQIYLFKDDKVGRRHAAIHLVPGGFELEDLPLGAPTVINGKPAKRARLRHGDRISIGATTFLFQEKEAYRSRVMRKSVVINAVGLTPSLISDHTPRLKKLVGAGRLATVEPVLPAVTTTVQSTYLTGRWPSEHGIVGNGWYFRDECEVKFWKQSNALVQSPKIWDVARAKNPSFTCANVFWWYAMYSGADFTVTPRPMYPADGRKLPDVWTQPGELRETLQQKLGQFPLFKFWGPMTSIDSTRWIADAAVEVDKRHNATLTLIYLPHLDYNFQRFGPDDPRCRADLAKLDAEIGKLLDHFQKSDARVVILSEYGIAPASRPVHLNRVLRERGLITIREELDLELLDTGASKAFAVADHQVAHVYVNDSTKLDEVKRLIESTPGVARVLDESGKRDLHLDHPRSGELVAIADPNAWFTYYYWLDDARAPDFARTVDIHRKPGYDPVELFMNASKAKIAAKLLKKKLGFRTLLDVIPLDATLVKGSHGASPSDPAHGAMFATSEPALLDNRDSIAPTDVFGLLLRHLEISP